MSGFAKYPPRHCHRVGRRDRGRIKNVLSRIRSEERGIFWSLLALANSRRPRGIREAKDERRKAFWVSQPAGPTEAITAKRSRLGTGAAGAGKTHSSRCGCARVPGGRGEEVGREVDLA